MSFKVNSSQQISFNDSVFSLTAREKKALDNSWAKIFADEIFPNIDEERFSVLYSSKASRPNAPVNVIIGALIIKELFDYSDDEIVENLMLDLHLQYALHTTSFEEQPISDKTLSRFRSRCYNYETTHGIDLYHDCVKDLSSKIAKLMNLSGRIKRMDSMMIESNIRFLSRMELIYTCISKLAIYFDKNYPNKIPDDLKHYTKRIEANPQWELVEIYQDEGISATTVEKRLGFQEMIADAVDGKIDLILTKSISRFGRNIVDILDNLQTLSALNPPVSVEFETEGITYTGDGRNNLLISLLAALAEMESQQKSEAIKAGIRWRMAEGIYKFSVQNTLGFYRDHFGQLVIEPTEARIVEYIYESCLESATPAEIAAALTEQGIKSPMGNDLWSAGTVRSILRNEKYCGDALMQKTYTKDFRTHKSVKNTDLNMYFKENHHTAIIKKEDWIKVQKLLSERHSTAKRATLRRLSNHFVAYRVKDGLFKGYLIMDSRWSFMERQEFMKIVDEAQNTMK